MCLLCIVLLNHLISFKCIYISMRMFPRSSIARQVGLMVGDVTIWYQSQGFNAEPGWAG
jgi:hypothetical protein